MITQEDNQTITMADLPALDDSEWVEVEITNPLSEELVDHVLNRFMETA